MPDPVENWDMAFLAKKINHFSEKQNWTVYC